MKLQLMKARLQGIVDALKHSSEKAKSDRISWSLASDFNAIVVDIGTQFPDAKDALPARFSQERHFESLADGKFLDLEAKVHQLTKLIEVLESGS